MLSYHNYKYNFKEFGQSLPTSTIDFSGMSVNTCIQLQSRMDDHSLLEQIVQFRKSLFDQGYLDEQFVQLEELQDDANPHFVEEIVTSYYTDSARLIKNIDLALEKHPLDFEKLDTYMHQFKGSSSRCVKTFQMIKHEHGKLRKKLEAYFQLSSSAMT